MKVPREISMRTSCSWILFTDACYESDGGPLTAGISAVLNQTGHKRSFISSFPSEGLIAKINVMKRKTLIFECELFAIYLAMKYWSDFFENNQIVVCTDNEGVKDALISCQISSSNATSILCALLQLDFFQQSAYRIEYS